MTEHEPARRTPPRRHKRMRDWKPRDAQDLANAVLYEGHPFPNGHGEHDLEARRLVIEYRRRDHEERTATAPRRTIRNRPVYCWDPEAETFVRYHTWALVPEERRPWYGDLAPEAEANVVGWRTRMASPYLEGGPS